MATVRPLPHPQALSCALLECRPADIPGSSVNTAVYRAWGTALLSCQLFMQADSHYYTHRHQLLESCDGEMYAGSHPLGHAALHVVREQGGHLQATANERIQSMIKPKPSHPLQSQPCMSVSEHWRTRMSCSRSSCAGAALIKTSEMQDEASETCVMTVCFNRKHAP